MYRKVPLERIGSWPPNPAGLTSSEVEHRRQAYGPNDILEVAGSPWRELALDTAKDPMIWFLVGIAVLYAALGSTSEAVTLGLAILPLVAMDAFLHRRTQASTRGLSRQLAERASVFRDGTTLSIPAVELVPGDLVRVEVDVRPHPGQERGRATPALLPVDPPPGSLRLEPHRHVLGHGEVGEERRLLVDGGDAQQAGEQRVGTLEGHPRDREAAGVRGVGAGDDLHEGALAGPVFAHEGVHLPRSHRQGHVLEGVDAGERLRHPVDFEEFGHEQAILP